MQIGIKKLNLNFHQKLNEQFAVQNESDGRGISFTLTDFNGKVIEDESIKVSWDLSIKGKTMPDSVTAQYEGKGVYTIKYPQIAVQETGLAKAQITIMKDGEVLKSIPYTLKIYEDVTLAGEDIIELENQGERLKELIADTEKALEDIEQGLEHMDSMQEESKELIEINKQMIEDSKELIETGNQILEDANKLSNKLEDDIQKANELEKQLEGDLNKLDEEFLALEQKVDNLILSGNSMIDEGEDILRQAQEAIDAVNNAIEQGIDDEIQQIIEDKIAELSVSYNQLEDKPSLNGVMLTGNINTKDLNIKSSDLDNDKGFITLDEVSVIEGPKGEPGEDGKPGRDGLDGQDGSPGKDGKSIEYKWKGTELGIRQEGGLFYDYVNLKGEKGEKGEPGTNGRDGLDGERGPKGDTGPQGPPGEDGKDGRDGNDFNLPVTMNDGDYLVSNLLMYNRTSHLMPFPEFYFNTAVRADHLYSSQGATIKGRTIFESDGGTSTVSFNHDYVDIKGKKIVVEDDKGLGTVKDIRDNSNKTVWTGTESQLPSSRSSSVIYFVIE